MSKWIDQLKQRLQYFKNDEQPSDNLNSFMKKKQNIWGCIVIVIMISVIIILHSLAASKAPHPLHKAVSSTEMSPPDGVLTTDFSEKENLSALEDQQQQIDALNQHIKALSKLTDKIEHEKKIEKHSAPKTNHVAVSIGKLLVPASSTPRPVQPSQAGKEMLNALHSLPHHRIDSTHPLSTLSFHYVKPTYYHRSKPYQKIFNKLTHQKTAKTWVSAGTFARGVLLEGADANASVNGQSDTAPILVRLLDAGTLPNGGISHLKGCFVLASIYGDISSERGEARLNTLSCTRRDGSILEKSVQGYLSFAGKEGIKGRPVMRNGKILTMAGISGALSGIGSALQQSSQNLSTSSLGTVASVKSSQIWQNGAYGGASTAMGQLAHYYIQRANQYHPIISIGSGTVATVIFQKGFPLTEEHKQSVAQSVASIGEDSVRHDDEVKQLLIQAKQQAIKEKHGSIPFTNISNLKLGQTINNGGNV